MLLSTVMCGQDPMMPPFFFSFFLYKQHFATFYVSLYDIYTINTIKEKTDMDRNYCLIAFIVYMSNIMSENRHG